nr:hypothetical protein [Kibdelosporangium sp. MJ126-NF4]CTQ98538.1 hypothetical protein [Kibdelosporangium sp. MJ126-NF4]
MFQPYSPPQLGHPDLPVGRCLAGGTDRCEDSVPLSTRSGIGRSAPNGSLTPAFSAP